MNEKSKNISVIVAIVLMLFVGVFVAVKNRKAPATMDDRIMVTTSFYPLYFLTTQIGGDLINVQNLTPAGTEPHDYELTAQDITKIRKSKLLVLNGGGLEIWGDKINMNVRGPVILSLANELGDGKDPHIWLSPTLAIKIAERVAIELIKIDPKNQLYYESNLSVLKTELINLDNAYKMGLKSCQKKDFVTSHDAFGYLAQGYGLNQVSIAGLSPDEEPSSKQLADVAKFARDNQIKYIFFESLVSPKLSETIAREVGAQTLVLNPIEGLSEDELNQGKNYLTEMKNNLENLKIALDCN
ncbi:MAG: ABC-type metal ion transporter, periplasmic subunit [Candidatus Moranbacteria bacterium GW2011_GWF1_34_10]|nr:MAG: ABC-type metal ion transporter, periplasmic subunit [Candidatus Moranbacteria bacterium GW2011_GWF1_34_10]